MESNDLTKLITDKTRYAFSRSSGPGGQNVNKVNTKVTARLTVADLHVLSENERQLVRQKLQNRINEQDQIIVHSSSQRSQKCNKQIALEKLQALVAAALKKQRKRRSTAPSKNAVAKRLFLKKKRGLVKRDRQKPVDPGMFVSFFFNLILLSGSHPLCS